MKEWGNLSFGSVKGPKGRTDATIHLQNFEGMQSSKRGIWKGYHLSVEGIRKRYPIREKWYIAGGKGLDLGAEPPRIKVCWLPPFPRCPLNWGPQERFHCIWKGRLGISLLCPFAKTNFKNNLWKQGSKTKEKNVFHEYLLFYSRLIALTFDHTIAETIQMYYYHVDQSELLTRLLTDFTSLARRP